MCKLKKLDELEIQFYNFSQLEFVLEQMLWNFTAYTFILLEYFYLYSWLNTVQLLCMFIVCVWSLTYVRASAVSTLFLIISILFLFLLKPWIIRVVLRAHYLFSVFSAFSFSLFTWISFIAEIIYIYKNLLQVRLIAIFLSFRENDFLDIFSIWIRYN